MYSRGGTTVEQSSATASGKVKSARTVRKEQQKVGPARGSPPVHELHLHVHPLLHPQDEQVRQRGDGDEVQERGEHAMRVVVRSSQLRLFDSRRLEALDHDVVVVRVRVRELGHLQLAGPAAGGERELVRLVVGRRRHRRPQVKYVGRRVELREPGLRVRSVSSGVCQSVALLRARALAHDVDVFGVARAVVAYQAHLQQEQESYMHFELINR